MAHHGRHLCRRPSRHLSPLVPLTSGPASPPAAHADPRPCAGRSVKGRRRPAPAPAPRGVTDCAWRGADCERPPRPGLRRPDPSHTTAGPWAGEASGPRHRAGGLGSSAGGPDPAGPGVPRGGDWPSPALRWAPGLRFPLMDATGPWGMLAEG